MARSASTGTIVALVVMALAGGAALSSPKPSSQISIDGTTITGTEASDRDIQVTESDLDDALRGGDKLEAAKKEFGMTDSEFLGVRVDGEFFPAGGNRRPGHFDQGVCRWHCQGKSCYWDCTSSP